jgi:hypothetical protein
MQMIGHEHKAKEFPPTATHGLLQSFEQPLVIPIVVEDSTLRVATGHHVVNRTGKLDSQGSGHELQPDPRNPVCKQ